MADLTDLARDLRKLSSSMPQAEEKARRKTAEMVRAKAIRMSSGAFKQATFNTPVSRGGLGAPYGHGKTGWLGPRGPIPYNDPARINAQSGLFRSRWQIIETGSMCLIYNDAPYARFLEDGTANMIRRPLDVPLKAYAAQLYPAQIAKEAEALARRILSK